LSCFSLVFYGFLFVPGLQIVGVLPVNKLELPRYTVGLRSIWTAEMSSVGVLCCVFPIVNWDTVFRHRGLNKFVVHTRMCRNVGVLRLFPGITQMMVSYAISFSVKQSDTGIQWRI